MFGVELDPTTAAIAQHLYPQAHIRNESFADTRLPRRLRSTWRSATCPFGNIALHDKTHNAGGHSLHNHFIIKSLHLTRPGGVVAVLTSHYTMDAANPAARREIAELADLVAAVRLPTSAHQQAAGTQVVTDVLVLRRRDPADGPARRQRVGQPVASAATASGRSWSTATSPSITPDHVLGERRHRARASSAPSVDVTRRRDVDRRHAADCCATPSTAPSPQNRASAGGLFAAPLPRDQRQPRRRRSRAARRARRRRATSPSTPQDGGTFTVVTDGARRRTPCRKARPRN